MAKPGLMRGPRVVIAADEDALAHEAAELVVAALSEVTGFCCIALSGGSTPRRLYGLLAGEAYRDRIAWARAHVFFADERAVPPDHPESNFGLAWELLLSRAPIPKQHVHRMRGEGENLDLAAKEYEAELMRVCMPNDCVRLSALDLALLGIGEDGHTASLFPATAALHEAKRWVVANHVPALDAHRLTLTYPALAAPEQLAFIASGRRKAGVVQRVLAGDCALPATRAARHRNVTFLLDREAASAL